MEKTTPSHSDRHFHRLLTLPRVYELFDRLICSDQSMRRYVDEYIRPQAGARVLDIGCGTARILEHLPAHLGEYVGFDMNPQYITMARQRWSTRGKFFCQRVEDTRIPQSDYYDIILATAVLHHLDDNEAQHLFALALRALRTGGSLITLDGVYVEDQHPVAKWLIDRDRGKAVRTAAGYEALARPYFDHIEATVVHDVLRVPYTSFVMRCLKGST